MMTLDSFREHPKGCNTNSGNRGRAKASPICR